MALIFESIKTNPDKYAMFDEIGCRIGTLERNDATGWAMLNTYAALYRADLKQIRRKLKELNNARV